MNFFPASMPPLMPNPGWRRRAPGGGTSSPARAPGGSAAPGRSPQVTFGVFSRNCATARALCCAAPSAVQGFQPLEEQERVKRRERRSRSRRSWTRSLMMNARSEDRGSSEDLPELQPVVRRIGFGEVGEVPVSPIELPGVDDDPADRVPCPPMNLVAEWTTMSAPWSIGRIRKRRGIVLSTTSGIPASWAIFETDRNRGCRAWDSPPFPRNTAFVLFVSAFLKFLGSPGSTNFTSMPSLGKV